MTLLLSACSTGHTQPRTSPSHSAAPADASPTASVPQTADEVAYTPKILNACGLAGDNTSAVALGCGNQPAEALHVGATSKIQVKDQQGTPTGGSVMVAGTVFTAVQVGSLPDRRGEVLILDTASGDVHRADLGASRPAASSAGLGGVVVGGIDGRVVEVSADGTVREVGRVPKAVLALAVASDGVWVVESGGDVVLLDSTHGTTRQVGTVQRPSPTGVVATGDGELWVLSSGRQIVRFGPAGSTGTIALKPGALSLTACSNGTWVRYTDSVRPGLVLLDPSGLPATKWTPSQFPGYTACAGTRLWALSVDGHLLLSPQ